MQWLRANLHNGIASPGKAARPKRHPKSATHAARLLPPTHVTRLPCAGPTFCPQLLIYQEQHPGFKFRPNEWPAKLIRKEHRWAAWQPARRAPAHPPAHPPARAVGVMFTGPDGSPWGCTDMAAVPLTTGSQVHLRAQHLSWPLTATLALQPAQPAALAATAPRRPLRRYLDMLEQMAQMHRERELRRVRELGEESLAEEGGQQQQQQQQHGGEPPAAAAQQQPAQPAQQQWWQQAAAQREPEPLLTFTPSVELNELVRPADRWAGGMGCKLHHAVLHSLACQFRRKNR